MSRPILDVGDRVQLRGQWDTGIVTRIEQLADRNLYSVAWDTDPPLNRHGWGRDQLIRVGEHLQVGDWVRVTGAVQPNWTDMDEELYGEIGVIVAPWWETGGYLVCVPDELDIYECHDDQVERITRAEALA